MKSSSSKKFTNLNKIQTANIYYKKVPMAQFIALSKKIKNVDSLELANMYNEKCLGLFQEIENYKIEIENYKLLMVGLQESIRSKDSETAEKEKYKKELDKVKNILNSLEENKKNLSISEIVSFYFKGIEIKKEEKKEEKKEIDKEKEKKEIEKKEKEFEKERENYIEKINNLEKEREKEKLLNSKLINEIREEKDNLRKDYDLLKKSNKDSENSLLNEINEKEKKIKELNDEITSLKNIQKNIEKNHPKTDKELNIKFNQAVVENLFLMYLLESSANYGKSIKELNQNFDYYSNLFLKENLKIKNIFSSILDEFIHRIHKKADFQNLALNIFNYNCINKSEDNYTRYTESEFYTSGFVNDDLLIELNKKIYNYRTEIVSQIEELIQKCSNLINNAPELIDLKKYDNSCLYSLNKGHLRINLNKLDDLKSPFLLSYIKYNDQEINSVEFFGDVAYDKQNKCNFINEQAYQLITTFKEDIKKIYINDVKKILPSFVYAMNLLFENLVNIKEIYILNSNLDDNVLPNFKINKEIQYEKLDFSNNKISKLSLFNEFKSKQIILSKNRIQFKEGDNKISFMYLNICENPFSIKEFNLYMKESNTLLLNISDIKIKDVNEAKLLGETLGSMKKLKVLYLNNCQMNESIFKTIMTNIKDLHILELYLNNNNFGNSISSLNDIISINKKLIKIEMKQCQIGDDGLKILANSLERNVTIKEINLENNLINKDNAKRILQNIQGLKIKI